MRKKELLIIFLYIFCVNFTALSMQSTFELPQTLKKLSDSLNQLYDNLKQIKIPTETKAPLKVPQRIEIPQFCVKETQKLQQPSRIIKETPVIPEEEKLNTLRKELINREKSEQKPKRELKRRTNLSLYEIFTDQRGLLYNQSNIQNWLDALKNALDIKELNLGDYKLGSLTLSNQHEKSLTKENLLQGSSEIFLQFFMDNYNDHYYEINDEFSGYLKEEDKEKLSIINDNLTQQYYISLMPTNAYDLMLIIENLLHELQNNFPLRRKIFGISFLININFYDNIENQINFSKDGTIKKAIITIVPSKGKENAQYILNLVYRLFKNVPGLNITPSYHTKITDLIYYGQGDIPHVFNLSDRYNIRKRYPSDFDESTNLALYRNNFLGKQNDYALQNPAASTTRRLKRAQSAYEIRKNK